MPYSFIGIFKKAFFLYGSFGVTSSKFAPNLTRDGTLNNRGPSFSQLQIVGLQYMWALEQR
jgi:hypothetical protein